MRRTLALTAALIAAMACGDVTGPLGPLGFGIIQGETQQATAGEAQLDTPVVAMVWRDASGQAFIGAAPLYAQTATVTGVVGAVVCVGEVPIEGEPIVPHARCTSTLSDGTAVFHLTPPTTAGTHRTPIVAEVDGLALTPDTVTAVVLPGPADSSYERSMALLRSSQPRVIPDGAHLAEDEFGNAISSCPRFDAALAGVVSTEGPGWPACRSVSWQTAPATGVFEVYDEAGTKVGHGRWEITSESVLYLRAVGLGRSL